MKLSKLRLTDDNGTSLSLRLIWWILAGLIGLTGALTSITYRAIDQRITTLEANGIQLQVTVGTLKTAIDFQTQILGELKGDLKNHIVQRHK